MNSVEESSRSRAVKWLLRLSGVKALTEWTDGDILSWIIKRQLVWDATVPHWLTQRHEVTDTTKDGIRTVRIAASKENNKQYLYYVHGGGFLMEMYFLYWLFADRITSSLGAELAVPIYPLLPEANMEVCFQAILASYQRWYKTIPKDAMIHIIADSSGCSLALRLAQETVASGVPAPESLILISPWVDMNISDKRLDIYEQDDPFISVEALRECAAMAVPNQDYDDPRYSPLYGNLSGIGRLSVFTGTADTLYPNALALRNQATLAHVPINYYEHNGMFHIYPHFLVAEGRQAFAMIKKIIMGKAPDPQGRGFTIIR